MIRILALVALVIAALCATDLRERAGRALYHAGLPQAAAVVLGGGPWNAAALYDAGRYGEAAEAFRKTDFQSQHYDVGVALARAGRLKDAVAAFDYALVVDPNDDDARFNLALVEAAMRKARADAPDADGAAGAAATQNKRSNTASDIASDVDSAGEGAAGDRDSGRRAENAGPSKALKEGKGGPSERGSEPAKAQGSIGTGAGAGRTGDAYGNVAQAPEQLAHRLAPMQLKTVAASQRWLETLPDDPGVYLKRRIAHEQSGRKERGTGAPPATDAW